LKELVQLEKKSMVELKSFTVGGRESKQISDFDPDLGGPNYVVLEETVHRVCAPTDGQAYPIIFWTKDSPSDNTPKSEKIVSFTLFSGVILFIRFCSLDPQFIILQSSFPTTPILIWKSWMSSTR